MNPTEIEKIYDKLTLLKTKIWNIHSVNNEEKEILMRMTEMLDNTFRMVDDIRETLELS